MRISKIKEIINLISDRKIKRLLLIYFLLSIVAAFGMPILSYISRDIFNNISLLLVEYNSMVRDNAMILTVISAFIILIVFMISSVKDIVNSSISHHSFVNVQNKICNKYNSIKLELLENPEIFNMTARVISHIPNSYKSIISLITMFTSITSLALSAALIGSVRWYFVLLIVIPNLLYVYIQGKHAFEKYFLELNQSEERRKVLYMHDLLSDKQTNNEIRVFGLSEYLIDKFENLRIKVWKKGQRLLLKQSVVSFSLLVLSKIGLFACLFVTGILIINNQLTIGDFALILSSGVLLSSSFENVFGQLNSINMQFVYIDDYVKFIALEDEAKSTKTIDGIDKISFDAVCFSYPSSDKNAIENISFDIKKGETIAFVGENGSGKTTATSLLLGKFEPKQGTIKINNIPISEIMLSFRSQTACVFQNFARYKFSVRENLSLSKADFNENDIHENILNFVNDLPNGLDSNLGNIERGGIDISGGEWQRIAIQRALLKQNADLYILDEPSASLDPMAESALYEQFNNALIGKTKIIISHRLGACTFADRIFVFEKGKIIEIGTHKELMAFKGKYYEMYIAQRDLYQVKK